MNEQAVFRRN